MINDDALKAARATGSGPAWMNSANDEEASKNQKCYIARLIESREVPEGWLLRIKELEESNGLTKTKASQIIDSLRGRPYKQQGDRTDISNPGFTNIPAGYYAVPLEAKTDKDNDIAFYKVWKPKDVSKMYVGRVYQIIGPDQKLLERHIALSVIKQIVRYGIGSAAVLYGKKIGSCSQCNRRLSNRISRELGIGPVCGGRVFGEDWSERVNSAREAIIERGEDPNEPID